MGIVRVDKEPTVDGYLRGQVWNRPTAKKGSWLVFEIEFPANFAFYQQDPKEYLAVEFAGIYQSINPFPSVVPTGGLYPFPGAGVISFADFAGLQIETKASKQSDLNYRVAWNLADIQATFTEALMIGRLFPTDVANVDTGTVATVPASAQDNTKVIAYLAKGIDEPAVNTLGDTRIESFWVQGYNALNTLNNRYFAAYYAGAYFDLDVLNPSASLGFRSERGQALSGFPAGAYTSVFPGVIYNSLGQLS
jgi:hypothetical protein